jgi:hypothetical protein
MPQSEHALIIVYAASWTANDEIKNSETTAAYMLNAFREASNIAMT